jgi:hypothetical protein
MGLRASRLARPPSAPSRCSTASSSARAGSDAAGPSTNRSAAQQEGARRGGWGGGEGTTASATSNTTTGGGKRGRTALTASPSGRRDVFAGGDRGPHGLRQRGQVGCCCRLARSRPCPLLLSSFAAPAATTQHDHLPAAQLPQGRPLQHQRVPGQCGAQRDREGPAAVLQRCAWSSSQGCSACGPAQRGVAQHSAG